jgi:hypothetical protein
VNNVESAQLAQSRQVLQLLNAVERQVESFQVDQRVKAFNLGYLKK